MMESQDINNPVETLVTAITSDSTQPLQAADTNGETPKAELDTSPNAQALKELQSEVTTPDSSTTSEQPKGSENSYSNSEKDSDIGRKLLESTDTRKERFLDKKPIGMFGKLGMSQTNDRIYNNIVEVLNWLDDISNKKNQIYFEDIDKAWKHTKAALDLMVRLLKDKEEICKQLEEQDVIIRRTKKQKDALESEINRLKSEKDNLDSTRKTVEANYRHLQSIQQEANRELANYCQQISQMDREVERIKQQKQNSDRDFAELEASRNKLLAEVASLKRNTGTHYDGTSDRPQHHILTGEYKTLKEQNLDPLADSLFKFIAATNSDLKPQRREKVNDIKAAISAIVLIGGQAIMRGESTSSRELPPGMLDEMQNLMRQKLQLANNNLLPQVSELLTKAANLAQGNIQYPVPGKWQEQDFQVVSRERSDRLCRELTLNFTTLNQDIQTEMQKAIQNALRFLERAAIADPPACLSLEKEGSPFRNEYHEAAKGYDEEGKIVKAIYPVYLVNSEAKVKAIVLTEPSTQSSPNTSIASTNTETSSLTQPESSSNIPTTISAHITNDERERICLQTKLETKRESLIKNVKAKWILEYNALSETSLLETLSHIDSLDIIEKLDNEFYQNQYMSLMEFKQKINNLLC